MIWLFFNGFYRFFRLINQYTIKILFFHLIICIRLCIINILKKRTMKKHKFITFILSFFSVSQSHSLPTDDSANEITNPSPQKPISLDQLVSLNSPYKSSFQNSDTLTEKPTENNANKIAAPSPEQPISLDQLFSLDSPYKSSFQNSKKPTEKQQEISVPEFLNVQELSQYRKQGYVDIKAINENHNDLQCLMHVICQFGATMAYINHVKRTLESEDRSLFYYTNLNQIILNDIKIEIRLAIYNLEQPFSHITTSRSTKRGIITFSCTVKEDKKVPSSLFLKFTPEEKNHFSNIMKGINLKLRKLVDCGPRKQFAHLF